MSDALTAALMAQLFDVTTAGIVVVDREQRIVRFNRGAELMFGHHATDVIGEQLDMLIPARFGAVHAAHVRAFEASEDQARTMSERRDVWARRKDGSEFPAAAGIAKLDNNGQRMFAVFLNDLSESRKLEENARRQSEEVAVVHERARLARDLHDAVSQTLFSASLIADVLPRLWARDSEAGLGRLNELKTLNRSALSEMRMLLLELRPSALIDTSLPELLKHQVNAAGARSGIHFTLEIDPAISSLRLDPERHVALYRIAQESINNIIKHSGARNASVSLSSFCAADSHPCVQLRIEDDGRGLPQAFEPRDHHGLQIIRERAQEIGAAVSIDSASGAGTRIVIRSAQISGDSAS
jgi:PAS domain S-box-containing protein